jgi:FKBP-type peptidyl-prolyl cis-trans isomerase FkpA
MNKIIVYLITALTIGAGIWYVRCRKNCTTNCQSQQTSTTSEEPSMNQFQTTASGIKYTIITPGTGAQPTKGQQATVHYTGWLFDTSKPESLGAKFDSSVDRGTPFVFVAGGGMVIAGWDESVLAMNVGEKRRVILPPHLAYGQRGAGGVIPGNATLVFDIELLSIR